MRTAKKTERVLQLNMTDPAESTLVIIPAYNEERNIGGVVHDVVSLGFHVLVVDDGSADTTEKAARDAGASVIVLKKNSGKGAAMRKGFAFACEGGYDTVAVMDGDGQHKAEELPDLLAAMKKHKCDIVLGSRMHNSSAMPFVRRMTNRVTSRIVSLFARTRLSDSQSGFRLLRTEVLKNIALTTSRYDTESEMLIRAGRKKYLIREVPVSTIYGAGEKSSIRPLIDTFRFIKMIIKCFIS